MERFEERTALSDTEVEHPQRPQYRSEQGYLLPPGIIPWKEYGLMQTRTMWEADYALNSRVRGLEGRREKFVISEDKQDIRAFAVARAEFRRDTHLLAAALKEELERRDVHIVLNGPSEKRLLGWQRKLPRFTVACHPMLFTSNVPIGAMPRMIPSAHVVECLMHFDMERRLQQVRWHTNVDPVVLEMSKHLGLAIDHSRAALQDVYVSRNYQAMAEIIGAHISETVQFGECYRASHP